MKIKLLLLAVATLPLFVFSSPNSTIKGNKKMSTKEFPISDYNTLSIEGNPQVTYEQSAVLKPYLKIEVDDNIIDFIKVSVDENGVLKIEQDEDIAPTKYTIYTQSTSLKKIAISGNASVNANGNINVDEFSVNMAGNGIVKAHNLKCYYAIARIAGKGSIELGGNSVQASYDIAGDGIIDGTKLDCLTANATMVGNGTISTNAKETLNAKLSGSGTIYYKGDPAIEKKIIGDAQIEKKK